MKKPLLSILSNRPEIVADQYLQEVVDAAGDRLFSKIPVSEVIDIEDDRVTREADRRFLLMASFDFLVARDNMPLFCVEVDGRSHAEDPPTLRRDRKKDAVCAVAGLPLLRVASNLALEKRGQRSILKYIVDCYYLYEAFYQAQEGGTIPWDEPFARASLTQWTSDGVPVRSIDDEVASHLAQLERSGVIPIGVPDTTVVRIPERRNVRFLAYLAVGWDRLLFADVQVRDFRFVGIRPSELAESLALSELCDQVDKWVAGQAVAIDRRRIEPVIRELQIAIDEGHFLMAGSFGPNSTIAGIHPVEIRFRQRD